MKVYLALGSNLGERETYLHQALVALEAEVGHCTKVSSFYHTKPVGFVSNHNFLNAAVEVETTLSPEHILAVTQNIELRLGRTEKTREGEYTDRTIDIDILCSDQGAWASSSLTLPHPKMAERDFVLIPLSEIAPDFRLPCGDCVEDLRLALEGTRTYRYTMTKDDLPIINELMYQLTTSAATLTPEDVTRLAAQPMSSYYVVRDHQGEIKGMITLCISDMPTGRKAWAEDLIVDACMRGRGCGKALILRAAREARRAGAKTFNFTSSPNRVDANAMYVHLGFERRNTNVYRMQF